MKALILAIISFGLAIYCLAILVVGYIHKPFHFDDFIQRVHEAVDTV